MQRQKARVQRKVVKISMILLLLKAGPMLPREQIGMNGRIGRPKSNGGVGNPDLRMNGTHGLNVIGQEVAPAQVQHGLYQNHRRRPLDQLLQLLQSRDNQRREAEEVRDHPPHRVLHNILQVE
eukprot:4486318-Karenia_brevis.AAC.1